MAIFLSIPKERTMWRANLKGLSPEKMEKSAEKSLIAATF
jgi:hypothetical protein